MRFALLLILATAFFLTGCSDNSSSDSKSDVQIAANEGRGIPESWKVGEAQPVEDVMLTTSDGVKIAADFRPAAGNAEKAPIMILVHMLGKSRKDYKAIAEQLSGLGIASLAIDIRGHGDSKMGGKIRFSSFNEKQWNECVKDVNAAIGWALRRDDIDGRLLGLMGASIGANLVIKAGSREEVKIIVALSPGLVYHGIEIEKDAAKIHEKPVFVVATDGDEYCNETASKLAQVMQKHVEIQILEGRKDHGTDMFRIPAFQEGLLYWIGNNLGKMNREAITKKDMSKKKGKPGSVTSG